MLLLLPPSEGKTAAERGAPVEVSGLTGSPEASPDLTERRSAVLDALVRVSARPDAATLLGVGPGLAQEVARNTALRTAPAARASRVYSGVLYAAAGLDDLPPTGRRRAQRSVRTVSALWGLVAPGDRIPAYRLAMGTDLPGVGPLAAFWRPALAAELDPWSRRELVVDCRSGPYVAAWRPPRDAQDRWVQVRVLREQDGRRAVVSHMAKHTRGVLTRHLLTRTARVPGTPQQLREAAAELTGADATAGGVVLGAELHRAGSGPWTLDVVTS